MKVFHNFRWLVLTGCFALFGAGSAGATIMDFTFGAPSNYWGAFSVSVTNGVATSGTGTFHDGRATALMTLLTSGTQEFNDGTDLIGITSNIPIDYNGLTFAVGPDTSNFENDAGLNIWAQNGSDYSALFGHIAGVDGGAENYQYNGVPAVVPEGATWTLMMLGMAALGAVVRRRRGVALAAA